MIFPISGPSGAGKTTTLRALQERLTEMGANFAVRPGLTRDYLRRKGVSLEELRKDSVAHWKFQTEILQETLDLEKQLCRQYEIVLSDRSVFDGFLFALLREQDNASAKLFDYLKKAVYHSQRYGAIFVLEPLDFYEEDGVRDADKQDMEDYFNVIRTFPKTIVVKKDSVDERVNLILFHIFRLVRPPKDLEPSCLGGCSSCLRDNY